MSSTVLEQLSLKPHQPRGKNGSQAMSIRLSEPDKGQESTVGGQSPAGPQLPAPRARAARFCHFLRLAP